MCLLLTLKKKMIRIYYLLWDIFRWSKTIIKGPILPSMYGLLIIILNALVYATKDEKWLQSNPRAHEAINMVLNWIHIHSNQSLSSVTTAQAPNASAAAPAPKASAAASAPKASAAAPAPKASAPKATAPKASAPNASAVESAPMAWKKAVYKKKKKKQSRPQIQRNPKCSVPGDDNYVVIQNQESGLYIVWAEKNGEFRKLKIYNNFSSNKYLRTFKSAILPGEKERGEVLYSTLVERGGYLKYSNYGWASFCVDDDRFYCDLVNELHYE